MGRCSGLLCWLVMFNVSSALHNPFIAGSLCETRLRQLDSWRLSGIIFTPDRAMALITTPQQVIRAWPGSLIAPGVRVVSITACQVRVVLAGDGDKAYYHWGIQGKTHGKNDSPMARNAGSAPRSGRQQREPGI